jgi:uncharacterized protein (DUF983 family)
MPFNADQNKAIAAALTEKGVVAKCPSCGHPNFFVAQDLVAIQLQPNINTRFQIGGQSLPSIAVLCINCGDTRLFNVFVLGLGHLFGLTPADIKAVTNG